MPPMLQHFIYIYTFVNDFGPPFSVIGFEESFVLCMHVAGVYMQFIH